MKSGWSFFRLAGNYLVYMLFGTELYDFIFLFLYFLMIIKKYRKLARAPVLVLSLIV